MAAQNTHHSAEDDEAEDCLKALAEVLFVEGVPQVLFRLDLHLNEKGSDACASHPMNPRNPVASGQARDVEVVFLNQGPHPPKRHPAVIECPSATHRVFFEEDANPGRVFRVIVHCRTLVPFSFFTCS